MTTGQRALGLITGNLIITFVLTLLTRNLLINPELHAIEQAADRKEIVRIEQLIDDYRENIEERVRGIYSAVAIVDELNAGIHWRPLIQALTNIGEQDKTDYFILSDDGGAHSELHSSRSSTGAMSAPLKPSVKSELLRHVLPRLSNESTISGLYHSPIDGPLIYGAGRRIWKSEALPTIYIVVKRLSPTFIKNITQRLDIELELSPTNGLANSTITVGQRNAQGVLYSVLYGDDDQAILRMRFPSLPRSFDDKPFSVTLWIGTLVSAGLWSLYFVYLYYRTITPVRRITQTLQIMSQTNNFDKHLLYNAHDEVGELITEFNTLLQHVVQHTKTLEGYSYEDALTELGNRRYFQEKLQYHGSIASRQRLYMSAIVFDLDYFKQYNDNYGHDGGDEVLRQFAQILKSNFTRELDVIARTGGDEFIVLILDVQPSDGLHLAKRAIKGLYDLNIPHCGNPRSDRQTASAGVATGHIDSEHSVEALVNQADSALYRAKAQGHDQACQFREDSQLSGVKKEVEK